MVTCYPAGKLHVNAAHKLIVRKQKWLIRLLGPGKLTVWDKPATH